MDSINNLTGEIKCIPECVQKRRNGEFLKGPIPLAWLTEAAKLPRNTFVLGIAIWFASGVQKTQEGIKLTQAVVARFGLDKMAKSRGLRALESAGLVLVDRRPGKNPVIRILRIGAVDTA